MTFIHPRGITKAPASPHTTRAGEAYREGHPSRVKARGGGGKDEEGTGLEFISISPQRILMHWLCVLCDLCGAVLYK
ncbi:MAG: hypothetical protein HF974_11340 [ANME-2 cluster archaeon]|nr:hypothetical protein [ANME-2 cluster archaeon]